MPQQQRVAPQHALKAQPRERRVVDIILPRREHGLKHEPHRALDPARGRERQRAHLAVGAAGDGQRLHGGHVPVPGSELRCAHRKAPLRAVGRARQQRPGKAVRLQPHGGSGGGVRARAAAADAQRVPAREALPGLRYGEAVRAVREQRAARGLGVDARALGRIVRQGAAARLFGRLLCPPPQRRRAQRQPLGQQGRVRAHGGVGEEPPPHLVIAQRVARRQQAHALVVRHHAAHDLPAAARARAGAVERVEKSVLPQQPECSESAQVAHRRARLHRQREKAAVRREHELFVHARLQGQRRTAVRLVAVAQRAVEREVRALRHAPWLPRAHAPPLHVEAELCALPQQGVAHRRQKQLRHQVLEHRPRPRHAAAVVVLLHLRARQGAPVLARHVAPRHGEVRRQPCLACQQVIVTLRPLAAAGVDADVHQPPLRVVERAKVHAVAEYLRPRRQLVPSPAAQGVCRREQGGGAVAAVHRGHIQRRHRPQRARVVPVVKMPVPAGQLLHGREHPLRQLQPASVVDAQRVCAEGGHEREPHVRRRRAVRRAGRRLGLHVVRRQVVILGCAERLKILPRRLRPAQQLALRRARQGRGTNRIRRAERCQHEGTEHPHDAGGQPRRARRQDGREQAQRARWPERAQIRAQPVVFAGALRRRLPLQQVLARYQHAPQRRHDGGGVEYCLPRQQDQPQHRLCHGAGKPVQHVAVVAHARVRRVHDRLAERADQPLRQRQQRRIRRQPQPRPAQHAAEEDGKPRRRGDERPPQIVRQPEPVDRVQHPSAPREDPRCVLPVAADPAVRPRAPGQRRGGEGVRQLHVAEKAAVQVRALKRVVAQHAPFRDDPAAAAVEQRARVDDALAREAAAVKAVHI